MNYLKTKRRKYEKHLKNVVLLLLLIILSSIALACAQNKPDSYNEPDSYREAKKIEIQSYVTTKLQDNYSEENRVTINEVLAACNKSIDDAKNAQEADLLILNTKQKLDGIAPIKSAELKDGAYFITDSCYEWYKTKYTTAANQEVPQHFVWALIFDGQITVSDVYDTVYMITDENDIYSGTSLISNICIWSSNGLLYVRDNKKTIQFQLDSTYDVSAVSQTQQLSAPTDIDVSDSRGHVSFVWPYDSNYGSLGCGAEIKNSEYTEYTPFTIDHPYMNTQVVQLSTSDKYSSKPLMQGENLIRLHNIGGYSITNTKKVYEYLQSPYVTYRVVVDGEKITVELI